MGKISFCPRGSEGKFYFVSSLKDRVQQLKWQWVKNQGCNQAVQGEFPSSGTGVAAESHQNLEALGRQPGEEGVVPGASEGHLNDSRVCKWPGSW